jgi:hypothetical protein
MSTAATAPRLAPRLRWFGIALALTGWFALALQLYLSLQLSVANGKTIAMGFVIYFGFFTILTNLIVAVALSAQLFFADSRAGKFFARPDVNTAVAAYIAVVGIVYSLLLRHIWNPQGAQLLVDRLLHDVVPVAFLVFWWFAVPKQGLRWLQAPRWLVYPLAYFVYSLIRGELIGLYPYPFIDVTQLGYERTFINAAGMVLGFLVVALALIALSRLQRSRAAVQPR